MTTAQLLGKCERLRHELSRAYRACPRNMGYIARLAAEIDTIEQTLAASQRPTVRQSEESSIAQAGFAGDWLQRAPQEATSRMKQFVDTAR